MKKKLKNIQSFEENGKILCRSCAEYGNCKLEKKGTATKCRKFWKHIDTEDFLNAIKK